MKIFHLLGFCLLTINLIGQDAFSGVFQETETELKYLEAANWEALSSQHKEMDSLGYRLIDLEGFANKDNSEFWAIWQKDTLYSEFHRMEEWVEVVKMKRKMVKLGFILDDIEVVTDQFGDIFFVGVWKKGKEIHKIWKLDSWNGLLKKNKEMARDYMVLVDIEPYIDQSGVFRYLAVYHPGGFFETSHVFTSDDQKAFNVDRLQRRKSGYRMMDFELFSSKGKSSYIGVFHRGTQKEALRQNLKKDNFEEHRQQLKANNSIQLVDIEIHSGEGVFQKLRAEKGK